MKKCIICDSEIKGFGHNAEPVKKGTCCEICNTFQVIPMRLGFINSKKKL